jgi:hypothetical protein
MKQLSRLTSWCRQLRNQVLQRPLGGYLNKGGLRSSFFRRVRDYTGTPPNLLWSRGWFAYCDYCGDGSFLYRAYPTRYMVDSLHFLRNKQGVFWLRMGVYPVRADWGKGHATRLGDIVTFSRDVVGTLSGPTVLITTDGDMSVPSDLPYGVAENILGDPNIVAWHTQNYDRSIRHPKLHPLPTGLGLHAGVTNRLFGIHHVANVFRREASAITPSSQRILRVWSDVHLKTHPNHFGDSRATIHEAINTGALSATVDFPACRLPQHQIWRCYRDYAFVLSLPGHGWDCYRTWEALALGAVVITIHSPLDRLLTPYRVVFLDSSRTNWWKPISDMTWLSKEFHRVKDKPIVDLSWQYWARHIRDTLTGNKLSSSLRDYPPR